MGLGILSSHSGRVNKIIEASGNTLPQRLKPLSSHLPNGGSLAAIGALRIAAGRRVFHREPRRKGYFDGDAPFKRPPVFPLGPNCEMQCDAFSYYNRRMTIHLRNFPPDVERSLVEKSAREGISLSKAAGKLIEQALISSQCGKDFGEFAGTWNEEECSAFDAALESMRQINPRDWAH